VKYLHLSQSLGILQQIRIKYWWEEGKGEGQKDREKP